MMQARPPSLDEHHHNQAFIHPPPAVLVRGGKNVLVLHMRWKRGVRVGPRGQRIVQQVAKEEEDAWCCLCGVGWRADGRTEEE